MSSIFLEDIADVPAPGQSSMGYSNYWHSGKDVDQSEWSGLLITTEGITIAWIDSS